VLRHGGERGEKLLENEETEIMLNPYYRAITVTDNEVYFTPGFRSSYSFNAIDDKELNLLGKLVEALRKPTTFKELSARLNVEGKNVQELKEIVSNLYKSGVVCQPSENPTILYYRMHYDQVPSLAQKKITVIGAGPLGSRVISSLLKMNVGVLKVLDGRKIKDLPREKALFPYIGVENPEGTSYIELLEHAVGSSQDVKERLSFQDIKLNDIQKSANVVEGSDLTIVALENYQPTFFQQVNTMNLEKRLTTLFSFVDGNFGVIGPFVIPNETPCYLCVEQAYEASVLQSSTFFSVKEYMKENERTDKHVVLSGIPPLFDIVSGYVVDNVVRFLIGDVPSAMNRILYVDFETLTMDIQDALRNPRCPACSRLRPPHKVY